MPRFCVRFCIDRMKAKTLTVTKADENSGFDLFRLSKSKDVVDVCSNTLRGYFKDGLPFYRRGKASFVSNTELAAFIRG